MSEEALLHLRESLAPSTPKTLSVPAGFRRAGVLVPILCGGEAGPALLFTVRSRNLKHHGGQIAFPGGALEPGESPEDAARREAWEEVGLEVPSSALWGRLGELPSPARYLATPVVAVVPPPERIRLQPSEVEEAFTAPLAELAAIRPLVEHRTLWGQARTLHRYRWRGREIWGFTGNVLRDLLGRLESGALEVGGP